MMVKSPDPAGSYTEGERNRQLAQLSQQKIDTNAQNTDRDRLYAQLAAPALQGDEAALNRLAATDPKRAEQLLDVMTKTQQVQRTADRQTQEQAARLAAPMLQASPEERAAMWPDLRQKLLALNLADPGQIPQQWDESLLPELQEDVRAVMPLEQILPPNPNSLEERKYRQDERELRMKEEAHPSLQRRRDAEAAKFEKEAGYFEAQTEDLGAPRDKRKLSEELAKSDVQKVRDLEKDAEHSRTLLDGWPAPLRVLRARGEAGRHSRAPAEGLAGVLWLHHAVDHGSRASS